MEKCDFTKCTKSYVTWVSMFDRNLENVDKIKISSKKITSFYILCVSLGIYFTECT